MSCSVSNRIWIIKAFAFIWALTLVTLIKKRDRQRFPPAFIRWLIQSVPIVWAFTWKKKNRKRKQKRWHQSAFETWKWINAVRRIHSHENSVRIRVVKHARIYILGVYTSSVEQASSARQPPVAWALTLIPKSKSNEIERLLRFTAVRVTVARLPLILPNYKKGYSSGYAPVVQGLNLTLNYQVYARYCFDIEPFKRQTVVGVGVDVASRCFLMGIER